MAGRMWRALTTSVAATQSGHEDPRLQGRTYAIPFEDVWSAARMLASGGLRGWRLVSADDDEGVIEAAATTLLLRRTDDVVIRVLLDEDAQTRVDARSAARKGFGDGGRNARRLHRFFRALDQTVLDARRVRLEARADRARDAGDPPADAGRTRIGSSTGASGRTG